MAYNILIDTAVEAIRKRYSNGMSPAMGDTVCVICAGNGSIYTGINVLRNNGNIPENIHAEIDAINRMRADGETVVKAITVFNSCNVSPILPCNGCINLIISLNSENVNAEIVTPSGNLRITDIGRMGQNPPGMQQRSLYLNGGAQNRSVYMNQTSQSSNGPVYMNQGAQNRSVYMDQMPQNNGSMYMNQGAQNQSVYLNQMPKNNGSVYMNQGAQNQSVYLNPMPQNNMNQNVQNQSVYLNQTSDQGGASMYMNASPPNGSTFMSSNMQSSMYMGQGGVNPGAVPGVKSYANKGNTQQKTNILRNKLNNLLNDDDE